MKKQNGLFLVLCNPNVWRVWDSSDKTSEGEKNDDTRSLNLVGFHPMKLKPATVLNGKLLEIHRSTF